MASYSHMAFQARITDISLGRQVISRLMQGAMGLFLAGILFAAVPAIAGEPVVFLSAVAPPSWTQPLAQGLSAELGPDHQLMQVMIGKQGQDEDSLDRDYEWLAGVYAGTPVAAVVTVVKVAFAFMRKYGDELFPGVPVVYTSMIPPLPGQLVECGECTGVPLEPDIKAAVEAIFMLRPRTRLLVGIMDGSPGSRVLRRQLEMVMETYMDRAQLQFPGFEPGDDKGLTMESLRTVASSIPGSASVLFLRFAEGRAGNLMDEAEAVRMLSVRSAAPVFVMTGNWFDLGVLGGPVVSPEAHGRKAGELVRRILAGESAHEMLPEPPAAQLVVDGTVAARFGVELPPDALVVNEAAGPDDVGGVMPTDVAGWAAGVMAFGGLLFVLRRFTGRRNRTSGQKP